jgi:hypothetical protein
MSVQRKVHASAGASLGIIALLCAIALLPAGCSVTGGPAVVPYIGAVLLSFTSGQAPAGLRNAGVFVLDAASGESITGATVTMNGVRLAYNPAYLDYEGIVLVSPGDNVTVRVEIDGRTYTAAGSQFTSYPEIVDPVPWDTWEAGSSHTVSWTAGAPTANAVCYELGVLDAGDPNGPMAYPIQVIPIGTTSWSIPPRSVTAGDRLVMVGLVAACAIPGASPESIFVIGGFGCVPVTVQGIYVSIRPAYPTILMGTKQQFTAVATSYYDGSTQDLTASATWTSSNTGVATISNEPGSEGTAEPVSSGTTTIAAAAGALADSTTLTVLPWTLRNSGVTEDLNDIAASGSRIVAVGGNGTIVASPDAVTWTARVSGTTQHLNGVVWTGDQFVAVGNAGTVLTSPDGDDWTGLDTGTGESFTDVAWSGTVLVAVGDHIYTYSEDVGWTARTDKIQLWSSVASSGEISVAAGALGTLSSTDGVDWPPGDGSSASMLAKVIWTGDQIMAVGINGVVQTSPDGTVWTTQELDGSPVLRSVAWSGRKYVAVGSRSSDGMSLILYSDDGASWAQRLSWTNLLYDVAWFGTRFTGVGMNGLILAIPEADPGSSLMAMETAALPAQRRVPAERALWACFGAQR